MSAWYISFVKSDDLVDYAPYNGVMVCDAFPSHIGYSRPDHDNYIVVVDTETKLQLLGNVNPWNNVVGDVIYFFNEDDKLIGFPYHKNTPDFKSLNEKVYSISRIKDSISDDQVDFAKHDLLHILAGMRELDKQVGDIWKLPDVISCLNYAITEAAEYMESYLLQTRSSDSRNNKKAEDYDSATEMFDILMMLVRACVAGYKEVHPNDDPYENDACIQAIISQFDNLKYRNAYYSTMNPEPAALVKDVAELVEYEEREYLLGGEFLQRYAYKESIFESGYNQQTLAHMIFFLLCHPFLTVQDVRKVADRKFAKIYNKSMSKKKASEQNE